VGEAAPLLGRVSVAPLPEDRRVAAWSRNRLGAREAVLQIVEADGAQGTFQRLGTSLELESGEFAVLVSTNASGRIVAVWAEPNPVSSPRLLARFFDADGQPIGASIPVASSGLLRDVELRDDGTFLVVWMEGVEILARAYGSDGLPLGPRVTVNAGYLGYAAAGGDAATTPTGWMVAWSDYVASANEIVGPWVRSLETRVPDTTPCPADVLCLNGGRFRARVTWRVSPTGAEGLGIPIPLTGDTGAFWFFAPSNYELAVKVLDGRGINGHFWVFYGSLTDVAFDLTVTDVLTGQQRTYHNPAGTMASHADTLAF
jgi:hypothetical protein